jgi:hypothetical protein
MASRSIKELRDLISSCEDEEPITCYLEDESGNKTEILVDGASSTAGGRATILWFKKRDVSKASSYQI